MTKSIKTVKEYKTARRFFDRGNVTIFQLSTYGYFINRGMENLKWNVEYQIFDGLLDSYPIKLDSNQEVKKMKFE